MKFSSRFSRSYIFVGSSGILVCIIILLASISWSSLRNRFAYDSISQEFLQIGLGASIPLFVNIIWDCISAIFLRVESLYGSILRLILIGSFFFSLLYLWVDVDRNYHNFIMICGFWSSFSVAHVVAIVCSNNLAAEERISMKVKYRLLDITQCLLLVLSSFLAQILLSLSITHETVYILLSKLFRALVCAQSILFLVFHAITRIRGKDKNWSLNREEVTIFWHLVLLAIRTVADNVLSLKTFCVSNNEYCEYVSKYYLQLAYVIAILTLPDKVFFQSTINRLLQVIEEKTSTTRYVTHELRTPMNIIHLSLKYVQAEIANLRSQLSSIILTPILMAIDDVNDSCDTAISILDEFLTMDKMQSGKLIVELEEIEPIRFIHASFRQFAVVAQQNDIRYELLNDHDVSKPLRMHVDTQKLGQVMRNILSNAFKFTPKGGSVTVKIGVGNRDGARGLHGKMIGKEHTSHVLPVNDATRGDPGGNRPYLEVRVTDTGAGISASNQGKLFGQYVQFNAYTLQKGKGSALGLWISRGIVELHNGSLTAESAGEGHGCTFILQLPLLQTSWDQGREDQVIEQVQKSLAEVQDQEDFGDDDAESFISQSRFLRVRQPSVVSQSGSGSEGFPQIRSVNSFKSGSSHRSGVSHGSGESGAESVSPDQFDVDSTQFFIPLTHPMTSPGSSVTSMMTTARVHNPAQKQILVVDDSALCRRAVRRSLEAAGHSVTEARGGVEALGILASSEVAQVQVILMDNYMAGMDGTEATKRIRDQGFTGLIVALTGDAYDSEVEAFLSSGADHVMTKPLNMVQLAAIMCKYFDAEVSAPVEAIITADSTQHCSTRQIDVSADPQVDSTQHCSTRQIDVLPDPQVDGASCSSCMGVNEQLPCKLSFIDPIAAGRCDEKHSDGAKEAEEQESRRGLHFLVVMAPSDERTALAATLTSRGHRATFTDQLCEMMMQLGGGGYTPYSTSISHRVPPRVDFDSKLSAGRYAQAFMTASSKQSFVLGLSAVNLDTLASVDVRGPVEVTLIDSTLLIQEGCVLSSVVQDMRERHVQCPVLELVDEDLMREFVPSSSPYQVNLDARYGTLIKTFTTEQLDSALAQFDRGALV